MRGGLTYKTRSMRVAQLRMRSISNSHQHAQVAQLVEQGTENPCVGGSIPPLGTI